MANQVTLKLSLWDLNYVEFSSKSLNFGGSGGGGGGGGVGCANLFKCISQFAYNNKIQVRGSANSAETVFACERL